MKRVLFAMIAWFAFGTGWAFGQSYTISTVVGKSVIAENGRAADQPLPNLSGVAVDSNGNIYIAAPVRNRVYKVTPAGVLTTFAGTTAGFSGDGGPAIQAQLRNPQRVAVDSLGNVYISDAWNYRIRKVGTDGIIRTIAGSGTLGDSGDGGSALSAQFRSLRGLAPDHFGGLYVADRDSHRIRKVSADGRISAVAGTGSSGFSGDGGAASAAQLNRPNGLALDSTGNLYVADESNYRLRKITASGTISTFAGNGSDSASGDGGLATAAGIGCPTGVTIDSFGNVVFADECSFLIRKISPAGMISKLAGTGGWGFGGDGSLATNALFRWPWDVASDSSGGIYVADTFNARIRVFQTEANAVGTISTMAGIAFGPAGDGAAAATARLGSPSGMAADSAGNLYIVDTYTSRLRKVSPAGTISSFAGTGTAGFNGDGVALTAQLFYPRGVAVDASGNVYVADTENHRIRKIDSGGNIATVAGTGSQGFSGDGGPATSARLYYPAAVAVDAAGNLYIADWFNNRVRKVANGIISTIAGTGTHGFSGDGSPAVRANLASPFSIAVDSPGNVYVADSDNNRIRKISTDGNINTVGGSNGAVAVAVSADGGVFFASNYRVYRLKSDNSSEVIAGSGDFDFKGDGGPALSASLVAAGMAVDSKGRIFVSDDENLIVRKLTPPSASAPVFGYAIMQAGANQVLPAGLLVLSSVQDGIITSETAVPATPPVTSAMLFVEFSTGNVNTAIAIANPNAASSTVQLELWSADGRSKLANTSVAICGRCQIEKVLDQLFPDYLSSSSDVVRLSLIVGSTQPLGIVTFRMTGNVRGDSVLTTLPVTDMDQPPSSQSVYFPEIADGGGYATEIILQNPTLQTMTGVVEFHSPDGSSRPVDFNGSSTATLRYSIPSHGLFVVRSDGTASAARTGSAIVRPDPGQFVPSGTAVFSLQPDGLLMSEAMVPASLPLRRARMYVDYYSNIRNTGIAVAAPVGTPIQISATLTVEDAAGSQVFTSTLTVPAGGQTARFVSDLFFAKPSRLRGVLELSASNPFAVVTLRQTSNARGDVLFTTLPVANPDAAEPSTLIFPLLAMGSGYQTELILVSNEQGSRNALTNSGLRPNVDVIAAGVVSFVYSENGEPLPVLIGEEYKTSYNFTVPHNGALQFLPTRQLLNPVIITTHLADARVLIPYQAILLADGGSGLYGPWQFEGTLWPNLAFAAGAINGTPQPLAGGTSEHQDFFKVRVQDFVTGTWSEWKQLSLTTRLPRLDFPLPASLVDPLNPAPVVNQPYLYLLPLPTGGIGPFHFELGGFGHGGFGQFGGGFPPYGIYVNPNGTVQGRAAAGTDKKTLYTFDICAVDDTTGESSCKQTSLFVLPPLQAFVGVLKIGTGTGTVTSTPKGINCDPTCVGNFPLDGKTIVTLSAAAADDSQFIEWGGDCKGAGACRLKMDKRNFNVTARFEKGTRKIRVYVAFDGEGIGRVVSDPVGINCYRLSPWEGCDAELPAGTIHLTPTEDRNSKFVEWKSGCDQPVTPLGKDCIFTTVEDRTVVVKFERISREITVIKRGTGTGNVSSDDKAPWINCATACVQETETFDVKADVNLIAHADAGSTFAGWGEACAYAETSPTCHVFGTEDATAIATFNKVTTSATYTGTFTNVTFPSFTEPNAGCTFTARMSGTITLTLNTGANGAVTGTARVPSSVNITPATSTSGGDTCTTGGSSPTLDGSVSGTDQSFTGTLSDHASDRPYTMTIDRGTRSGDSVNISATISRTFATTHNGVQSGLFPRTVSFSVALRAQ